MKALLSIFCHAESGSGREKSPVAGNPFELERGPYRLVRHPIYTGLLAMLIVTVIQQGHIGGIIGLVLVFVSLWIKLSEEEQMMLKQFPDEYAAYRQRVRRIIPFIL
jgi:protein-S-isoprenylcysteine O-methyltransferase Ste14